jgi:hypothetical protein
VLFCPCPLWDNTSLADLDLRVTGLDLAKFLAMNLATNPAMLYDIKLPFCDIYNEITLYY